MRPREVHDLHQIIVPRTASTVTTRKIHIAAISAIPTSPAVDLGQKKESKLQRVKRIFTAPIDGIAAFVRKCYPSNDCLSLEMCQLHLLLIT
jgi:hypothetical protein